VRLMKWAMPALALAALVVLIRKELPSIHRYLKIERM
jgi:hypothetical protein